VATPQEPWPRNKGHGNNGAITGAAYVPGYSGTALRFHGGQQDNVSLPLSVFNGFGKTAYFEAMIRPTAYAMRRIGELCTPHRTVAGRQLPGYAYDLDTAITD
jgi:hypothetical protein